jgi:hypothetical protein
VRRRCGFLAENRRGPARLVWVQGETGIQECPKSYVTAESVEMVERFAVWRKSGAWEWGDLMCREAEAFQVLEEEGRKRAEAE